MTDSKKRGPPKDTWRTPPDLLARIEKHFNIKFTLDPCAAPDNHLKIEKTYTEADNGLAYKWVAPPVHYVPGPDKKGSIWVNPPFKTKWMWAARCLSAALDGEDVWFLIEAGTDTFDFHLWARYGKVYLLRRRIEFLGDNLETFGSGFRGSALFHFRKGLGTGIELLDLYPEEVPQG